MLQINASEQRKWTEDFDNPQINSPQNKKSNTRLSPCKKHFSSQSSTDFTYLGNQESVYSFLHCQLSYLYKWLPIDLDIGYLKSIRKQGEKGQLLRSDWLIAAIEVLASTKNKEVKRAIEDYREKYACKFGRREKHRRALYDQKIQKTVLLKKRELDIERVEVNSSKNRIKSEVRAKSPSNVQKQKDISMFFRSKNPEDYPDSMKLLRAARQMKKSFELPEIAKRRHFVNKQYSGKHQNISRSDVQLAKCLTLKSRTELVPLIDKRQAGISQSQVASQPQYQGIVSDLARLKYGGFKLKDNGIKRRNDDEVKELRRKGQFFELVGYPVDLLQ